MKVNVNLKPEDMPFIINIMQETGRTRHAVLSSLLSAAIDAARKSEDYKIETQRAPVTEAEKIDKARRHARLNTKLLTIILSIISPDEDIKSIVEKYL